MPKGRKNNPGSRFQRKRKKAGTTVGTWSTGSLSMHGNDASRKVVVVVTLLRNGLSSAQSLKRSGSCAMFGAVKAFTDQGKVVRYTVLA